MNSWHPMNINHFQSLSHRFRRIKILALLAIFSIFFAHELGAANITALNDIVSVEYVHGWTNTSRDIQGALRFKLSPGWKTYWRNPGPFGIKPTFDWTQSNNIKHIELSWPTPKIFQQYDVKVIGYQNILTIPIKITKMVPLQNALLNINLEFGVCSDICLLKTVKISTPLKSQTSKEKLDLITTALKELPSNITDKVFSFSKCSIDINGDDLSVAYSIHLSKVPNSKPSMIIDYALSDKYIGKQMVKLEGKRLFVNASLTNIYKNEGAIERNRLSALLILEDRGFEIDGCN